MGEGTQRLGVLVVDDQDSIRHFGGRYRHTLVRGADGALKIQLQRVDLFNVQAPFDYVIQIWV